MESGPLPVKTVKISGGKLESFEALNPGGALA